MAAHKRLQREIVAMQKSPPEGILARPQENDLLTFHFVIQGPANSPFAGGHYHGLLKFPPEYPMKPPGVLMLTPNGRFTVNTRICLSMSDYHPELWNPVWSVDKILVGLLSFMLETGATVGSITTSDDAKRRFATESLAFNVRNKDFASLFPELVQLHGERVAAAAAAGDGSGGAGASAGEGEGAAGSGGAGGGCCSVWGVVYTLAALLVVSILFTALDPGPEGGAPGGL